MEVLNVRRGRRQTFQYGNDTLSITELLRDSNIVRFLERDLEEDRHLTYASQRERIRRDLRRGTINPQLVAEYVARNPVVPRQQGVQDILYGAQRRRAGLQRRNAKGEVLFWPEPPPRRPRAPRRPAGAIDIDGERLTARQVLERFPQLREFLQQERQISAKSLLAKMRKLFRENRVPNHILREPRIVSRSRLLEQRYRTLCETLCGKHLADGLFKFRQERRDKIFRRKPPEQGPNFPDLRDGEGGPCYRGSYV